MKPPGPIPFRTKAEWVYAGLRERITGGELRPGQRLRLSELAGDFQTSAMPVREALRMLQRDGLVHIESHRGATVADPGWDWVYQAVLVRMHLEVLAVREATPFHDARTLAALERLLGAMEGMARQGQPLRFSRANRDFHTRLYEPAPYPLLREEIQDLWDRLWRTRSQSLFRLRGERMAEAHREHVAILDAVRAGDPARAARAAEEHRARTLRAWHAAIDRLRRDEEVPAAR